VAGLQVGAAEFAALSRRLKDAGETELRRELYKAISDAARPLGREIRSPAHLHPYMPDHYVDTALAADLTVTVSKRTGRDPGVSVRAKGKVKARHVKRLEAGILMHPVFGDSKKPRKTWRWVTQTKAMRPGFFSDPAEKSAPGIRDAILAAMHDIAARATKG
jgi:hypothetical protein